MAAGTQSSTRTDFVFMLVALYFILISFFIILSTLSVRDSKKLQSAVSSVSETFKIDEHSTDSSAAVPDDVSGKKHEGGSYGVFLNDLQDWISTLNVLGKVNIDRKGNEVTITIRHPDFFEKGTTRFSPQAEKIMVTLAELLSNWQTDYVSELEIIADEPTDKTRSDEKDMQSGAAHAATIAAFLVQHNIDANSLYVTMKDSEEPIMSFTFIISVPPKL